MDTAERLLREARDDLKIHRHAGGEPDYCTTCELVAEINAHLSSIESKESAGGAAWSEAAAGGIAHQGYLEAQFSSWWGKRPVEPNVLAAFKAGALISAPPAPIVPEESDLLD